MKHLVIRVGQMLMILAALSVFLFALMLNMPGNPVDLLITSNPRIKPEDVVRLKKLKGLDRPWYVQYYRWMWGYYEPVRAPEIEIILPTHDIHLNLVPYVKNASSIQKLFGGEVSGGRLWFVATNANKMESVGSVVIESARLSPRPPSRGPAWIPGQARDDRITRSEYEIFIQPIPSQAMEKPEEFSVDLSKYVAGDTRGLSYRLLGDSPGQVDSSGIYRWIQKASGQKAVQFEVSNHRGEKARGAFSVEQDPIPNYQIFNRGFLFVFIGDTAAMGFSNTYKRPVWDLLRGRIANTLALMIPAILFSLMIALPLGVLSACRQHTWLDYVLNFLAFVGISLPVFWFAIMMMYSFSEHLQWFPAGGIETPGISRQGFWVWLSDRLSHAALPILVLSIAYIGRWLRYMRASMLEVLPADYVRTARAKGLSERWVIFKHALRNALIPIVTILALSVPVLFGGAVLTETVFSWPGIGRLEYDAISNNDYYVAIVVFLISAALVMLGNLLADGLYLVVDPRMRKS